MAKNTLTTAFYQTEKDLKHPIPIRAYKDRIFRMIFKEKWALLALYNAMNDTAYQDPEELVITTLENAIYLGMKNDVSFIICDRLFLYEHQSTKNPVFVGADRNGVFQILLGLIKCSGQCVFCHRHLLPYAGIPFCFSLSFWNSFVLIVGCSSKEKFQ